MHMIRETFGIHINYPVHDTLTMSRLLDQRGVRWSHDLDKLASVYVDPRASEPHEKLRKAVHEALEMGKRKKKNWSADWLVAPIRVYGEYGGLDPWYTLRLYDQFIDRIRYWPQPHGYPSLMSLYENEQWLTLALRDMEERGIMIDQDFTRQWIAKAQRRVDRLTAKMDRRAGYEINWRSIKQVRELFWDDLELPQIDGETINKRALLKMSHPLAAMLLQHRKQSKMVSSGEAMLRNLHADGALHAWFNQNVDTGRMSAKEGVHQFARESGIRAAVKPRKGFVLRSLDYSQIEMRFAAHYSKEGILVEGFRKDPKFDTHAALARRMFGVQGDPSPGQRDRGKTMNFAMLYGAGIDAVTEQLIDKLSREEARQSCRELDYRPKLSESPFRALAHLLRDAVRSSYPKVWAFTKEEEEIAKHIGFVTDAFGYHRYLDEDESYKAFNSKLQGSAAHQAKKGMVAVYRELQLGTGELACLMQVHDDIVFESEGDPQTDRRAKECLEDHHTFHVPIVVDVKGSAINWEVKETIKLKRAT
jgi:DNA polymerase-1